MKPYSTAEQRKIAIGAVRHILKTRWNKNPDDCTVQEAWEVLSDMRFTHRNTIAYQWLEHCTPSQERLFKRDWDANCKRGRELSASIASTQRYLLREQI